MVEIVTYESKNARPHERWMAYAVLPNGELWLVRCTGETEEIAATKARSFYENEKYKTIKTTVQNVAASSQHHLAGKIWMINKTTGDKKRIDQSEITDYEWRGYVRGGPRS